MWLAELDPKGMMGVDKAVFIRIEDAYTMADESGVKAEKTLTLSEGMVSSVLVRVDPGVSPSTVGREIRDRIPGSRMITPSTLLATVTLHLAGVTRLLLGSAVAVMLLSVPLLTLMSAMVAHELKREIEFLGALGVTKVFILQLILAESFTSSVLGSLIGIGSAAIFLISFENFITFSLEIPFNIAPSVTLIAAAGSTLLLCILITGIVLLYPTIRIVQFRIL